MNPLRSVSAVLCGSVAGVIALTALIAIDWSIEGLGWHWIVILFTIAGVIPGYIAAAICEQRQLLHGFLAGCGSATLFVLASRLAVISMSLNISVVDRPTMFYAVLLSVLGLVGARGYQR